MKLRFRIPYFTAPGEQLRLEWENLPSPSLALSETAPGEWTGEVVFSDLHAAQVPTYRYAVWQGDRCLRRELGHLTHRLRIESRLGDTYFIDDRWRDLPTDSALFSSAVTYPTLPGAPSPSLAACSLTWRVLSPALRRNGCHLALLGSSRALGAWDEYAAIAFDEIAPGVWQLTLDAALLAAGDEYKFVAVDEGSRRVAHWETGDNRILELPALASGEHHVLPETEVYFPELLPRMAGTAIPVFSLRSEGSQGVGDFGDLRRMVDWTAATGQRVLQILPIHDTTLTGENTDSYPYNAISVYAFHPMYVDLRALPALPDARQQAAFDREFRELNALPTIDYARVNKLKRDFLLLSFRAHGRELLKSQAYATFAGRHAQWLPAYAAFSALRDKFATPDFHRWPQHAEYDAEAVAATFAPGTAERETYDFYCYVQYLLHSQLSEVTAHARRSGVVLKGDIPIGIARCSVEAWTEPHYFNLNGSAGAPPDAFSLTGQNWGFPTYNWAAMAADGYAWWKRRYVKMAEHFSAYRIDHILGFFRIWEIPTHSVRGLLGRFVPALPYTVGEIEAAGLPFGRDFMTRPFVNDALLDRLFGERAEWVRRTFLTHSHYDIWHFRPEFATQRAVDDFLRREYRGRPDETQIREGLFALLENVLFIEDPLQREHYHPRIEGFRTFVFERLNADERKAYERLHHVFYYERHNDFWRASAMEKLPALSNATAMLPCGEDLGMVPDCVPGVMEQLQLLTLEIERMPKAFGREFADVEAYPRRSVCSTGTHDMATLRGWWAEDAARSARYFFEVLGHGGEAPADAPAWLCEEIVRRHVDCPSMLCILPWQDWLSIDERLRLPDVAAERINEPANPRHFWRYRMHIGLETLMQQSDFNARLRQLLVEGRRA